MTAQENARFASSRGEPNRIVCGQRRITPEGEASLRAAAGFEGLPPGATRWRLAAALRAAARKLGLSAPMLALLEHYIDLTYDIDWTAGSEPIVFRPLIEIAEHFGRSERQIRNLETGLVRRGLLAWRDSGNHHRKGRRSRDGRIIYAYGASLGPLGARYDEIVAQAHRARAEIAETRRLRIGIAALRRRLRAMLADAPTDPNAIEARRILGATPPRAPAGTASAALQSTRDALASAIGLMEASRTAGQAETCGRHRTETTTEKAMNSQGMETGARFAEAHRDATTRDIDLNHIKAQLLRAAAGTAIDAIEPIEARDTWRQLADKAEKATAYYGISKGAWSRACQLSNRYVATMAIVVLARAVEDRPYAPVLDPGGYFMAMVRKISSAQVDIGRTFGRLSSADRASRDRDHWCAGRDHRR